MNIAQTILHTSIWIALLLLATAFMATVWRVVKGPTLPDRVVALDMLVGIVIGFIALIAIRTGFTLYIDIAIALGLVGFLATVAFARFILSGAVKEAVAVSETTYETGPRKQSAKITKKTTGKTASKTAGKTAAKTSGKPAWPAKSPKTTKPGKGQ
ncbi:cation:proton antiporter [Aliirhizobium smilacinae]|uniref:Cation:proton antiporter n=1 Tax=Aliirhizobium smilacinae TaxID=1395944 RepID=A0A5C4XQS7_9HYPH|nr:cation:proton antiporter [Rhizobium smilacinae]TNM65708.1 cation:proton antiporter [Rhizobium smilacinae]